MSLMIFNQTNMAEKRLRRFLTFRLQHSKWFANLPMIANRFANTAHRVNLSRINIFL